MQLVWLCFWFVGWIHLMIFIEHHKLVIGLSWLIDWFWLILIDWYFLRKRKLISLSCHCEGHYVLYVQSVSVLCFISYTYIVIDCAHLTWRKEKLFIMQYLFLALVNRFNVLCTWSSETDQVFDSVSDQF